MASGLEKLEVPDDSVDPQEGTGTRIEQIGGQSDAQTVLDHDDAPADVDWSMVQGWIDEFTSWYGEVERQLLSAFYIDGVGIEISLGVEVGAGLLSGNLDPIGVSILWITNSEADASMDGVDEDPVWGSPHYYAFSSISGGVGPAAEVSGNVSVDLFYAYRYGPDPVTPASWAGPTASLDVEASLSHFGGAQVSASRFSSIDLDKSSAFGFLASPFPTSGWHGYSFSGGLQGGEGGEFTLNLSLVGASEGLFEHLSNAYDTLPDLTRPEVRQEMQETGEIPEQGEFHYQDDVPGGGFFSWFADSTSGVGEALEE